MLVQLYIYIFIYLFIFSWAKKYCPKGFLHWRL